MNKLVGNEGSSRHFYGGVTSCKPRYRADTSKAILFTNNQAQSSVKKDVQIWRLGSNDLDFA